VPPYITPVETSETVPASAAVVIIGGGIVGLTAAMTLSERGIPVVVLEKGGVAGEQSSRNQGWIRKTSRAPADVPLAAAADRLWASMRQRTGSDVGYKESGILFLAKTDADMVPYEAWMHSVASQGLDSRLVTQDEIDQLVPGGQAKWAGGIYTPSDGRAEPSLAASAIARAAIAKGAVIIANCAVRSLVRSAGRVTGVVTERGEINCDTVLLAGGLWSRRFLGNLRWLALHPWKALLRSRLAGRIFPFANAPTAASSSPIAARLKHQLRWITSSSDINIRRRSGRRVNICVSRSGEILLMTCDCRADGIRKDRRLLSK
jgi:glycine/D-amino acid oxidase-like deaminating enzyme